MCLRLMLAVAMMMALGVGVVTASASGSNSDAAKACQHGGWRQLVRTDGTGFKNEGDCVSYAAGGGTLMPRPTCTTGNENFSEDAVGSQPTTFAGGTIDTAYGITPPDQLNSAGVVPGGIVFPTNALYTGFSVNLFRLTFTNAVGSVQVDAESNFIGAATTLTLTGFDAANNPVDSQSAIQPIFTLQLSTLSIHSTSNNIKYFTIATNGSGGLFFSDITWGCN